jgi:flagellar protein FlaJ
MIPILSLAPFGIGFLVHFLYLTNPNSIAKKRGKKIDSYLPYALNFIATMSAAGITPHEIFISLSKQGIYGEVKEEASKIGRDITLLGMDVVTALKRAMKRTPSDRFREFLQGAVVTITSGGALKPYFMNKAQQYMTENRLMQKKFIEDLGVMAETYVVAAVVLPLLLLVLLPLMMMMGGAAPKIYGIDLNLFVLYLIVFMILPIIHFSFTLTIMGITPEVE